MNDLDLSVIDSFNTQPPEGGWLGGIYDDSHNLVSTHSRLKAAGSSNGLLHCVIMFQHTAA